MVLEELGYIENKVFYAHTDVGNLAYIPTEVREGRYCRYYKTEKRLYPEKNLVTCEVNSDNTGLVFILEVNGYVRIIHTSYEELKEELMNTKPLILL